MSESMVERVARILEPQAWAALGTGDTLAYKNRRTSSLRKARAAIEAMRDGEMTDAMYFAACDELDAWTDPTDGECIKTVFKTALDAAHNEQVAG